MTLKRGTETILQVVIGRGISPSPVPADLSDPHATWLEVILGSVSKATAEARKTVREKAEQHGFEAAIRIGVSDERATPRLRSLISALKVLESAGVRINDEAEKPEKINTAHVPWHFPLRLSVKELTNFLLLPAGEEELPGTPGLHPKLTLPPAWYDGDNDRFAMRIFMVRPGMKGAGFALPRKLMMKNLTGNSGWRYGAPPRKAKEVPVAPAERLEAPSPDAPFGTAATEKPDTIVIMVENR